MGIKNFKIVKIKWIDSKGTTGVWEHWEDTKPLLPDICISVGFLIDDQKNYKTIAQSYTDDQVLGRMTIPIEAIKKITVVKLRNWLSGPVV